LSEQPLELKASVRAIWWRRRLVVALAGIGLCGGIAYPVLRPPMPSAVALVLLPPTSLTSAGTPTRDVNTEIVIATSTTVLSAAGKSVSPSIGPAKLKHQVAVTAISQDVLQVRAQAPRALDAERLANAVASDYIRFVATSSSASTRNALSGLRRESSQLTQQIQGLQSQINAVSGRLTADGATSTAGLQDTSLLESLGNEQQQVSLQLENVNNEIVTGQLSGATAEQGTRILQRATNAIIMSKLGIAADGAVGLAIGLLLGIPLALVRSRRDPRLRFRDEMAAAIGVPVLGSIDARRHKTTADWIGLLANYQPSSVDVWNLRRVLHRLAPGGAEGASEVRVVSFADDIPALAAGPQLALFAKELGLETTLLPRDDEALAPLRAACVTGQIPDRVEQLMTSRAQGLASDRSGGQLMVSMVTVDVARPELNVSPYVTLLAVSSAFASADVLARLALAAVDSGHAIDGILVINPDPSDKTTGSVRDGVPGRQTPWLPQGSSERLVNGDLAPTVTAGIEVLSSSAANGNGAVPKPEEPEGDPGSFVSLSVLAASAKRQRRPLIAVALVGLLIGAGFHLVVPRKYAATTLLYLTEPAASDPAQAMANDISLLQTRAVAERAIAALHLHLTADSFLASYQGLSLSNAILSITLSAHSPTDAVARANAAARAFLAVRTDLLRQQAQVVVNGLQSQVRTIDSEINNLTTAIDVQSASPTGTSSSTRLADLVDQRSEDTAQVSQLETQIENERLNETSVTQASLVLDQAVAVKVSAKKVTLIDTLSGLLGGLGLALVVLIMGVLLSDRIRSRAVVAAAFGAPVELSLLSVASRRGMRKRRRHELLMRPTPELNMIARRLRAQLESPGGAALSVVEVESAQPCVLAVAILASSLASEGKRVVIADMAKGRPLASFFAVTSREKKLHAVTVGNQSAFLMVGPDDPSEMGTDWTPNGTDALLVLASVDPAFGAEHLAMWATKAVVVVNPRRAGAARINAIAELLRQARIAIRSVILIGVDPEDDNSISGVDSEDSDDGEQRTPGVLQAVWR
jgi:capsular polysaccharide biosynthesis protein